jgi:hypothetical protein
MLPCYSRSMDSDFDAAQHCSRKRKNCLTLTYVHDFAIFYDGGLQDTDL